MGRKGAPKPSSYFQAIQVIISRSASQTMLINCFSSPGELTMEFPVSSLPKTMRSLPDEITMFGIRITNYSTIANESHPDNRQPDYVSTYNFLMTCLEVAENIFHTLPNRGVGTQVAVDNYYWDGPTVPINISAVGKGLDNRLPIAFTSHRLILFVRFLGQIGRPFRWCNFECHFGWTKKGERRRRVDVVAEGRFEAFIVRPDYDPRSVEHLDL